MRLDDSANCGGWAGIGAGADVAGLKPSIESSSSSDAAAAPPPSCLRCLGLPPANGL